MSWQSINLGSRWSSRAITSLNLVFLLTIYIIVCYVVTFSFRYSFSSLILKLLAWSSSSSLSHTALVCRNKGEGLITVVDSSQACWIRVIIYCLYSSYSGSSLVNAALTCSIVLFISFFTLKIIFVFTKLCFLLCLLVYLRSVGVVFG